MHKKCNLCGQYLRTGELVELTVIAPYHELRSNVTFSIGTPVDSYPESLRHNDCSGEEPTHA
jgi:hypothetical protein